MVTAENSLGFGLDSVQDGMKYYAWLAQVMKPHLKGRVLEHGAGTGALSELLLGLGLESTVLSEPTPHLAALLRTKFEGRKGVSVFEGTLEDYLGREGEQSVGSLVSSNVLEHIEDDVGCLRTMRQLLSPGGTLVLYVPARPELYGAIDRAVGHCRRYGRRELVRKVSSVGFQVESAKYCNLVGGVGWFVAGRVLRQSNFGGGTIRLYDQVIFPVTKFLEELVPPPWGQNLFLLARKTNGC
jgi:phospholipid N-methyltransferase